jgi:hypothetical protein
MLAMCFQKIIGPYPLEGKGPFHHGAKVTLSLHSIGFNNSLCPKLDDLTKLRVFFCKTIYLNFMQLQDIVITHLDAKVQIYMTS